MKCEDYHAKKKKGWILKLVLKKEFDRVDWEFIEDVWFLKGFDSKWITWIKGCISNPKFSVFVNGRPRGRILVSRGIRQGDPIFPFLFLLVSEVLSAFVVAVFSFSFSFFLLRMVSLKASKWGKTRSISPFFSLLTTL